MRRPCHCGWDPCVCRRHYKTAPVTVEGIPVDEIAVFLQAAMARTGEDDPCIAMGMLMAAYTNMRGET